MASAPLSSLQAGRAGVATVGFPSPADDYADRPLDLHELLIPRPAATFFVRAQGDAMSGAGIHDGDLLIIDRSLAADSGRVIVAVLDGELTVKRLQLAGGRRRLITEGAKTETIELEEGRDFDVWGVVTAVIHRV